MRPEDVPDALVEKAYRARAEFMRGAPIGDLDWQAVWSTIESAGMRAALAAVLPEIRAQALESEARTDRYDRSCEDQLLDAADALRAARLTTTTEEPT